MERADWNGRIFAVYKPKGPTSHDVVDGVRKLTGVKTVGHAGTLDPLARGVLVIGVGREATRKLHEVVRAEKEYVADVVFGAESVTDDAEGEKTPVEVAHKPSEEEIRKTLLLFRGEIMQMPPQYSALKIGGRPAYKFARKGRVAPLEARKVLVKEIELLEYEWPHLRLRIVTGAGVYIRSLARDLGRMLKVGGHLSDLERTRVGDFGKDSAMTLENLPGSFK
jgi:tRNA pseudouridine55 synthase